MSSGVSISVTPCPYCVRFSTPIASEREHWRNLIVWSFYSSLHPAGEFEIGESNLRAWGVRGKGNSICGLLEPFGNSSHHNLRWFSRLISMVATGENPA